MEDIDVEEEIPVEVLEHQIDDSSNFFGVQVTRLTLSNHSFMFYILSCLVQGGIALGPLQVNAGFGAGR